jgi:hypothetical protein
MLYLGTFAENDQKTSFLRTSGRFLNLWQDAQTAQHNGVQPPAIKT